MMNSVAAMGSISHARQDAHRTEVLAISLHTTM
jgi:hypothetical protein